jgi:hypothetical protein
MSLWRFLLERDWLVQVFNPVLSRKNARTYLRGRKTDADDALFIARTVRDADFITLQPGQEDTQQLKLLNKGKLSKRAMACLKRTSSWHSPMKS